MTAKERIVTVLFCFLLLSCGQPTDIADTQGTAELASTSTAESTRDTIDRVQNQATISPYQAELDRALNDPTVDQYFKDIYNQEKLILADDSKMLSVPDSLTSKDPDYNLFYFIVISHPSVWL